MIKPTVVIIAVLCLLVNIAVSVPNLGGKEIRYEAESAFRTNLLRSTLLSCSSIENSEKDTTWILDSESSVIFTVHIPEDGTYPVTLQHIGCGIETDPIQISANGHHLATLALYTTNTWSSHTTQLNLRQGLNTISFELSNGLIGIDYITVSGSIPLSVRGATVPYTVYEAEDAAYTGTLIGPDSTYLKLPSEASARKAVQFTKAGDNVEFTLTQSANAMVIRFSIPDSSTGSGLWATLGVYVNGVKFQSVNVTSLYSWVYGSYPFSKNPRDGSGHHFYDDVRLMFGRTLSSGSKVRLQGESPMEYTIDLADFYSVPAPYPQPGGSVSVTEFGADPSGQRDSFNAFNQAVNSAKSKGQSVWIPQGKFFLSSRITVNQVTIRGAGPWYTELHGNDVGVFGTWAPNPSSAVKLYDFAVFGRTRTRDDQEISSGVGGSPGGGSIVQNIWIEHDKCGMWLDGPFDSLLITGCTIRNTFADGINLHKGVSNVVVEQTDIRNTGDDCLAMWPEQPNAYGPNVFKFNTLQLPILANTIAIYGGNGNSATDNLCLDTLNFGAGLQIAIRFNSVHLSGNTQALRNTLIRTGSTGQGQTVNYGAIWLFAGDSVMNSLVTISDTDIRDSFYSAIQFFQDEITNVVFSNITINGASFAIEERTSGSATFNNVVATNLKIAGQWNCGIPFKIIEGPGNSGWSDKKCTPP